MIDDLGYMLNQMTFISSELSSPEQISVENIHDIVQLDAAVLQDMDISQKRTLVCQEYERIQNGLRAEAKVIIRMFSLVCVLYFRSDNGVVDTTEMLMLLLWRHTMYYCDGHQARPVEGKSYSIRLVSMPEPEAFKQEVGKSLRPVLQRLRGLVRILVLHRVWFGELI